ncbi:MAG: GNAT family N-acetyltransferase [Ruminiclostridium sp.]|nr:GNAT family N-acetyltransferase [Ruminiclostridium sp.]
MDIRIKRAESSDIKALYNLNKAFNGDCTTEDLIIDSLQNNKQEIVLIAYADDNPAGFLCGKVCRSMCYKTLHGEVAELYVHEEYRRQGIAKKLIEQIEAEFRKNNIVIVDIATSVENQTAQAFYSNCGYKGKTKLIYRKKI